MLHFAVVLFVVALGAAWLGFGGLAAGAVGLAKVLFVMFALLSVASYVHGLWREP